MRDVDALMQLLDRESYTVAHDLEHYKVSRDVNSVRNNGPHLLEPLPRPIDESAAHRV